MKCPGNIITFRPIVLDEIKQNIRQDGMFGDFIAGFSVYYEDKTGQTFPFKEFEYPSDNYYELTDVLRTLLGRKSVRGEIT